MIQKFLSNLSQKEKKVLVLTIVIVLMAFLDRVFFGPAMADLKSLEEEIRSKQNSLKRYLRFISYRDQIWKEQELLKKYYTKKQLTPGEIKEAFLNKIEMLASEAKIASIRVTPSDGEKKKDYTEYSANLECTGKLKDVIAFMHAIDSSEELMKIEKFSMNPPKAGSEDLNASMRVSKMIIELEVAEKKKSSADDKGEVEKVQKKKPVADGKGDKAKKQLENVDEESKKPIPKLLKMDLHLQGTQ